MAGALALLRVRANGVLHAAWAGVLVAMLLMPALPSLVPAITVPLPAPARHIAAVAGGLAPRQPVARAPTGAPEFTA